MSRAAFSSRVFATYLFVVGAALVFVPNVLLSVFGIPGTCEVWIRVIGVLAVNIGVYAWVAAEDRRFLAASVYTRCVFFAAVTAFVLAGLASPMIVLFGVLDLLGALWTGVAMRADLRLARLAAENRP